VTTRNNLLLINFINAAIVISNLLKKPVKSNTISDVLYHAYLNSGQISGLRRQASGVGRVFSL
jgi:hypothetical protein